MRIYVPTMKVREEGSENKASNKAITCETLRRISQKNTTTRLPVTLRRNSCHLTRQQRMHPG